MIRCLKLVMVIISMSIFSCELYSPSYTVTHYSFDGKVIETFENCTNYYTNKNRIVFDCNGKRVIVSGNYTVVEK